MTAITPVSPIAHSFEWDAKRNRITGIRFKMDDGSERQVAARGHEVEMEPAPADEGWLVDVRV